MVLTNEMINTINADVHAAETTLDTALAAHQALPARLPLAEVNPDQQVLDTETKLIHHAIRIAAFNTAQSLARAIVTATGYTRADDEAHTLIRTALVGSGDIIPDHHTLHIRLDPLSAPRHTAAIDELCQALNDTNTGKREEGCSIWTAASAPKGPCGAERKRFIRQRFPIDAGCETRRKVTMLRAAIGGKGVGRRVGCLQASAPDGAGADPVAQAR